MTNDDHPTVSREAIMRLIEDRAREEEARALLAQRDREDAGVRTGGACYKELTHATAEERARLDERLRAGPRSFTFADLHRGRDVVFSPARPYRRAAHDIAVVMTAAIELIQHWHAIERMAEASGVDYERIHTGRKSVPTQPSARTYGLFPPNATNRAWVEERHRELWIASCRRRLEGALTAAYYAETEGPPPSWLLGAHT